MLGCLRRLIGLAILLVIALFAWMYRDRWMPGRSAAGADTATATIVVWQPVSDSGAARGREAIQSLARDGGPAYVDLEAGDLLSYVAQALARRLPASASDLEAAVRDDQLVVRATIALDDAKIAEALGPLSGMLRSRETVEMAGELRVVEPGLGELRVAEVKVGDLRLPGAAIPALLRQIRRGEQPTGVADNALTVELPEYIGDVRVRDGRITLYKAAS
ncbi:MAG TPA: hypothetical protein VFG84_04135 [Gemmatimonadaceae bacterium]|nr:hypothetical protein [Gemmatimonadaceae bacterium]